MALSLIERSAPRAALRRATDGPLTAWALALDDAARSRVFQRLIRADVALATTFPAYADVRRVERVCFLVMCEAAASRGLHAGELAMLSTAPERDALSALAILARDKKSSGRA